MGLFHRWEWSMSLHWITPQDAGSGLWHCAFSLVTPEVRTGVNALSPSNIEIQDFQSLILPGYAWLCSRELPHGSAPGSSLLVQFPRKELYLCKGKSSMP